MRRFLLALSLAALLSLSVGSAPSFGSSYCRASAQERLLDAGFIFAFETVRGRSRKPPRRRECWLIGVAARFYFDGVHRPKGYTCFMRGRYTIICKKTGRRFWLYYESE